MEKLLVHLRMHPFSAIETTGLYPHEAKQAATSLDSRQSLRQSHRCW